MIVFETTKKAQTTNEHKYIYRSSSGSCKVTSHFLHYFGWLVECCLTCSGKYFMHIQDKSIINEWWWVNPALYKTDTLRCFLTCLLAILANVQFKRILTRIIRLPVLPKNPRLQTTINHCKYIYMSSTKCWIKKCIHFFDDIAQKSS